MSIINQSISSQFQLFYTQIILKICKMLLIILLFLEDMIKKMDISSDPIISIKKKYP